MRRIAVTTVLMAALLTGVSPAPAADVGANDDSGKFLLDDGAGMYGDMAGLGLRQIVLTSRYKPSDPLTIQDKGHLDRTIPAALAAGLRVVVSVYPYPPREVETGLASPQAFGAYAASLAATYPGVRQFVVGNEPNQPAFWRPQFAADGSNASAASFGPYLAAAYDSLKGVDPGITVVGVGLSPRGNDRPSAQSNVSTSPVRFLRALGDWYRASGRSQPVMDGFSFHPYPNRATDSLDRGYAWPNAGFVNLDRIKQALWDAFDGTAQSTTLNGLRLHLDEVGWQVDTAGAPGYEGLENVVVTDEPTQAAVYGELVRRAACDPDIAEVSFFGFRDDGLRTGFQAALQRLDGTARPAAEAVRAAIADATARCATPATAWSPATDVLDTTVSVSSGLGVGRGVLLRAGEDARGRVCFAKKAVAGIERSGTQSTSRPVRCRSVALTGLRPLHIPFAPSGAAQSLLRASFDVAVELTAEANAARKTVVAVRAGASAAIP